MIWSVFLSERPYRALPCNKSCTQHVLWEAYTYPQSAPFIPACLGLRELDVMMWGINGVALAAGVMSPCPHGLQSGSSSPTCAVGRENPCCSLVLEEQGVRTCREGRRCFN